MDTIAKYPFYLSMDDLWNLIEDMARSAKQGQAMRLEELTDILHQIQAELKPKVSEEELAIEPEEPARDEDSRMAEEEMPETSPVLITEPADQRPSPFLIAEPAESYPVLNAEEIKQGPVLALGAPEEVPVLIDELPKSDPNLCVIAPGDHINDDDEDPWLPEEELHSDYPWELEEKLPNSGPVHITNLPEEITPVDGAHCTVVKVQCSLYK